MSGGLTIEEAAKYTGITRKGIASRVDRGTLPASLGDDGRRRIPIDALDKITQRSIEDYGYDVYSMDSTFDLPKAEIWGYGKAPVVKPSTSEQWEVVVGISDIHYPFYDPGLFAAALALAKDVNPHRFVINGDVNDFFQLSRFNTAFERLDLLQEELEGGRQLRRSIRAALPNAQIEETMGNHEERLLTYPGFRAPGLRTLDVLHPTKLLGLDELSIRHWPQNGFRLRDDFLIEHGVTVRSQSGATARARLEATLISGVMGHTHRMGDYRRSGYRELSWYEGGCLCLLNPDYVKGEADWKQGLWIGTFSTKTPNFNVQLISATGRGFIFDGKHYGNTSSEADIYRGPAPTTPRELKIGCCRMIKVSLAA